MKFNERLKKYRENLEAPSQQDFINALDMRRVTYLDVEGKGIVGKTAFKALAPHFIKAGELGLFLALLEEFAGIDAKALKKAILADEWVYLPELPEAGLPVITTFTYHSVETGLSLPETREGYIAESGRWWLTDWGFIDDRPGIVKIIAWQPMPEVAPDVSQKS